MTSLLDFYAAISGIMAKYSLTGNTFSADTATMFHKSTKVAEMTFRASIFTTDSGGIISATSIDPDICVEMLDLKMKEWALLNQPTKHAPDLEFTSQAPYTVIAVAGTSDQLTQL